MVSATGAAIDSAREFQRIKNQLHRQMVDAIDFSRAESMTEDELREQLRSLAEYLASRQDLNFDESQRDSMVTEIMDEIYGFGPLQPLMLDAQITDVLVNGPDRVLVERFGKLEETEIRFADDQHLMTFIQRVVGRAGRRIDESNPIVDARLPDGSRFNAVIPPLALCGPTISIRRFGNRRLTLEAIVKFGTIAPAMADFLVLAVQGRMNIIVSGGTGAGKTTLLNCISRYIPEDQRVVTIEETAELKLQQPDVIPLETRLPNMEGRGAITQRDLLRNSLRMRPDRIIVGESRGAEVLEMLQAMNTGHDGSMSTVHANNTLETLHRLELMVALSGADLPPRIARQYITNAVDIIVHASRMHNGQRRITRISEVVAPNNGQYQVEDVFVYRPSTKTTGNESAEAFFATGYVPNVMQRMTDSGMDVSAFAPLFVERQLVMGPIAARKGQAHGD